MVFLSFNELVQIHDLKFSNDGQKFLVVSGTTQAKLYDRDGEEQYVYSFALRTGYLHLTIRATFVKGDPYIRDMKHTSCAAFFFCRQ